MGFRRAFVQGLIAISVSSTALAASVAGRANGATVPDDQLLAVSDQCFGFELKDSTLTAFCVFQGAVPAKASVDLNSCIKNSSGEMLFAAGGTDALRTCSDCSLAELSLQCDCSTTSASFKRSTIELDGGRRNDGTGVFALVSGEMVCRSGS